MKKLTEFFNTKNNLHLEEAEGGAFCMEVPFLTADEPTANGRVYPSKILEGAIVSLQRRLELSPGFEASKHKDHLETDDVSHLLTGVKMKGKTAVATLRVLPTERGRDVAAIIKNGGSVGISSRGKGTVKKVEGVDTVGEDFTLEGVDFALEGGMYATAGMIFESAEVQDHLDEDTDLKRRFEDAVARSGFKGDFETFKMSQDRETMDKLFTFRQRFAKAQAAGYKGTETEYLDAMEKR